MILRKDGENSFYVIKEGSLTKQQISDREEFKNLSTTRVKLVAQMDVDNMAGYIVEDNNGDCHMIGYRFYKDCAIGELFLPPIVLPKPTMSLEDALIETVKFAHEYVDKNLEKSDAFQLPKEFIIAREVLGGRESGMEVFKAIVNVIKVRK